MMKIYNTKNNKREEFVSIVEGKVGMYVCGPTVYDVAHLGHGRSAVAFDVIRKYLKWKGYDVNFVSNYTDIDDKMINRAAEEGISVSELAEKVIPEYEKDYAALGVEKPNHQPRATGHIDAVLEIIKLLEDGGYIYVIDGDGVYFDVQQYEKYGELSGQNLEDLKMGARVEINEKKRNPYDFALWKIKKDGEPAWKSPWGEGRPGWHIECSAMSYKLLGREFDIHGGGLDLQFPHHECEVAQSVCALGEGAFAKYWLHNGFINVDNEKMSKSLGNFSTLKEIFKKYDPQVVRFMYLQTHYRNPINFSEVLLDQAKAALDRLHGFVRGLRKGASGSGKSNIDYEAELLKFSDCMDNDFDTSGAFGVVFELVRKVNTLRDSGNLSDSDVESVEKFMKRADEVLGVIFGSDKEIDAEVETLIKEREEARKNKDFGASDRIRDELKAKGIELEDTPSGTIWKKV
jgi:cysteinyl-tRNA synthetase